MTQKDEEHNFFAFGFIPSLFVMIIGVIYVSYQVFAFRHSEILFPGSAHVDYLSLLLPVWEFMKAHPSGAVGIVLLSFFVFLMFTFSPILCGGALIDLITKKATKRPLKGGFAKGLQSFFPLFEFAALTAPFGISTFLTELSLVLRNFGTGTWVFIIPILTAILIIGLFLSLLFVFAEQFIVLEGENVISAMKRSALLVLGNVRDIFFLGIAMALIAARVLFNIILILLIPLAFLGILAFMTSVALKWLGVVLGTVIGIAILIGGAYLMANFTIFTYALWTLSFIHFRKEELEHNTNEMPDYTA